MSQSKKWLSAGVAVAAVLTLAACSNGSSSKGTSARLKLPNNYSASAKATKAGNNSTLKVAEINDAPFEGITAATIATNAEDSDVFAPGGMGNMFFFDKNYKIVDGGLANQKLDRKNNTATMTLRKNAKWSNGQKVTAKDMEYPYEIIGNKDTVSQQYSSDYENIKGMAEYHAGTAKTISGITYPDGENGRKMVIHFKHMSPAMEYAGNSFIWSSVEPYEYIKNVPIAKLASAPQVRKNPIFVGPYKLDKMVQGESTSWVPNKYYYGKTPKIKHITIQVVSSSNATAAFKAKKYDFSFTAAPSQYPQLKKLKNYAEVGSPALSYGYFGFNVGRYDTKTGKNVMDKNAKMGNKNLRQAMFYALDSDAIFKKLSNGLSWRGNTLIPPAFKAYNDKSQTGFKYDMPKAKKLLDDAGYKKRNGSKWRSDPKGKKLVIYFGAMKSSAATESRYQYDLQQWHKLGLDVKMTSGKPMEMNSFYSTLQQPKQNKIDIFNAAWQTSSEPTPTQLYGETAPYNMGHFVSKKNTQLMANMNNNKSWNLKYRKNQFYAWQKYMNQQAAYVPDNFSLNYTPVNKRVKGYSMAPQDNQLWAELQLTSANLK
ncbi:oligopeptide ABC transporter substrate-binding protein [Lacticaseibacillus pabuli]|uniref:Oligopeptide ABC transporter substrate-binding protein n=1 Tax=Lacticaseibacillus pabuli TaxID=3025672 RepID=A0ABY7WXG9_9LACO|nr:oligopeptide ABC transporter substrate-binding protein [Lacticaseibacillus sp. KACC 23028]WDF83706.1 oligopeptide ABC transporter substrate-binding protein [Lacticaseibacillus sp. KACC 23028]